MVVIGFLILGTQTPFGLSGGRVNTKEQQLALLQSNIKGHRRHCHKRRLPISSEVNIGWNISIGVSTNWIVLLVAAAAAAWQVSGSCRLWWPDPAEVAITIWRCCSIVMPSKTLSLVLGRLLRCARSCLGCFVIIPPAALDLIDLSLCRLAAALGGCRLRRKTASPLFVVVTSFECVRVRWRLTCHDRAAV